MADWLAAFLSLGLGLDLSFPGPGLGLAGPLQPRAEPDLIESPRPILINGASVVSNPYIHTPTPLGWKVAASCPAEEAVQRRATCVSVGSGVTLDFGRCFFFFFNFPIRDRKKKKTTTPTPTSVCAPCLAAPYRRFRPAARPPGQEPLSLTSLHHPLSDANAMKNIQKSEPISGTNLMRRFLNKTYSSGTGMVPESRAPVRLLFIRCLICRMYRISYKSTEEKKKEQSCCVRIGFKGCMHSGKGNSNTGSIPLLPQCNSKVSSNTIDWVVNSQQILVFRGKNTINVKFTLTFDFWLLTFDFTLYTLHFTLAHS